MSFLLFPADQPECLLIDHLTWPYCHNLYNVRKRPIDNAPFPYREAIKSSQLVAQGLPALRALQNSHQGYSDLLFEKGV